MSRKQPVNINGRHFTSLVTAASTHRCAASTVHYRVYSDDPRWRGWKLVKPRLNRRKARVAGVVVIARGRRFNSYVQAGFMLGMHPTQVRARVMDDSYTSYYLMRLSDREIVEAG